MINISIFFDAELVNTEHLSNLGKIIATSQSVLRQRNHPSCVTNASLNLYHHYIR